MTPAFPRAMMRSPVAPLFEEPSVSSVQISQLLGGHSVELLEERDGWWCVRGRDLYEGWMHHGYLAGGAEPLVGERVSPSGCRCSC